MGLIDNIRARWAMINEVPEPETPLQENLPKRLRQNAHGLEQVYGSTRFIDRIRRAADRLETMELTLIMVAANSKEKHIREMAEDALK